MLQRFVLLALVSTLIPLAPAQEVAKETPKEPEETRIVRVHHIAPSSLPQLFSPSGVKVMYSDAISAVSLTGTKERLSWAAEQIQLLDVASMTPQQERTKNVEIMVHYLGADVGIQPIPAKSRLNAVVEQLRESFPYQSYSLLASYMIRALVSPGAKVEATGVMPPMGYEPVSETGDSSAVSLYDLSFELPMLEGEEPNRTALIRRLRAHWRLPVNLMGKPQYVDAEIQTGVHLPEGKLVVLGKAGLPGEDKGIFLVLEARPVE